MKKRIDLFRLVREALSEVTFEVRPKGWKSWAMPPARRVHWTEGIYVQRKGCVIRSVVNKREQETRWDWRVKSPKTTPTLRFIHLDVRWCHLLRSRTLVGKTGSNTNTCRFENPVRHPMGLPSMQPEVWVCCFWSWCSSLPHLCCTMWTGSQMFHPHSNVCPWVSLEQKQLPDQQRYKTERNYYTQWLNTTHWDY